MSGDHAAPSSNVASYFSNGHQPAGRGSGEQNEVAAKIVELSEIIVREVESNTWRRTLPGTQTIFHVPKEKMRAADKGTYQPSFLSFGPYHRGEDATEEMRHKEQGKLWWLGDHIRRGGASVLQFTQATDSMEAKARDCYEGDVNMERDAFCKMLLLDAFQLTVLLELLGGKAIEAADPSSAPATASHGTSQPCRIRTRELSLTFHDLMMLENQIPFFVVEKIYELRHGNAATTTGANGTRKPVAELAWKVIEEIMSGAPTASAIPMASDAAPACNHLVHLCQIYLKPSCLQPAADAGGRTSTTTGPCERFRRATEYYGAGVKFRRWGAVDAGPAGGARRSLLDVAFSDGALRMAQLKVDEKTGYILGNVLAYEQKYFRTATSADGSYVTAYVVFMSQLLGSPEDVALLARRGVVKHLLSDNGEVCALFRRLAEGLVFDPDGGHYLNPVGVALQAHCRSRLQRWRAWVVRHRFSNPWLVVAWFFGASAVLGTIVQAVFAVLSYVKRR